MLYSPIFDGNLFIGYIIAQSWYKSWLYFGLNVEET